LKMKFLEIKFLVETKMSADPKRWRHVEGTVRMAEQLAIANNVDREKAMIAAVLHDAAKGEKSEDLLIRIHRQFGSFPVEKYPRKIWHAMAGVDYAREEIGIEDADILNAILFHTTGRENMSTLEKIVFVSDYLEETRAYADATLRKMAYVDLNKTAEIILKRKRAYVESLHCEAVSLKDDMAFPRPSLSEKGGN